MRLLRFENAADAADALGDAIDGGIPVSLIVTHEVRGEPDAEGNAPVVTPREVLPGYWLLTGEPGRPEEVATLDAGEVVETTVPEIVGCWLSPVPAGWPVEPLAMVETVSQPPAALPPLTARRLRLGLVAHGINTAQVAEAIAAIPDPAMREVAEIEWEYATTFDRDHPLLAQVGGALGLTSAGIDAMWIASAEL